MAYRILNNQTEVAEYEARLDNNWPVRTEITDHISRQLAVRSTTPPEHVVELCCGPGRLAETILRNHLHIHYTGLDVSAESLHYAENRLQDHAHRLRFIQADLNTDGWWEQIKQPISAIVTMQSMHDLGDEAAVERMYGIAGAQLAPGGLFLNADLLAYTVETAGANPGRLTVLQHLMLLRQNGFVTQCCTLEKAGFGCVAARTAQ